jgi:hypothetical protein
VWRDVQSALRVSVLAAASWPAERTAEAKYNTSGVIHEYAPAA